MFIRADKAYEKTVKFLKKKDRTDSIDSSDVSSVKSSLSLPPSSTRKSSLATGQSQAVQAQVVLTKDDKHSISYVEHKALKALELIQKTIGSQEIRETNLETKIKDTKIEAKNKLDNGNKRAALRAMKKVKLEEVELNKVSSVIETLEAQLLHIESSLNNIQVFKVMQEGSTTLQNLNTNSKVEDIDIVLDNIRESMDITAEVNQILSAPVDNILLDDDELLKELESYDNNDQGLTFPAVPDKTPIQSESSSKRKKKGLVTG